MQNAIKTVRLRFYSGLNDFLPEKVRQRTINYSYRGPLTIKEAIESIKVPYSEVKLILANGQPVDYDYHLNEGDYISIYPHFERFDISTINQSAFNSEKEPKFVIDAHLGKLAKYLRMFGFDSFYENDLTDKAILNISLSQGRIILSKDKSLLSSRDVLQGYFVRSIHPREQLAEVILKFDLKRFIDPLKRCLICNHLLTRVDKKDVLNEIDENTGNVFNRFFRCDNCSKIYWEGSHFNRMIEFVKTYIK